MLRISLRLLVFLSAILISMQAFAVPARLAILGDSITHDGRWVTLVESALRNMPDFADAEIVNLGLPSETVSGLSEEGHAGGKFPRPCLHERLGRVLDAFKPTRVLACYGMNDGIYLPADEARLKAYQDGILTLKEAVEKQGGQIVFVTPPLYDADHPSNDPERYDAALDAQAEWLVSQVSHGLKVIDIRPAMREAVASLKADDPSFIYSKDGVHPGNEGHRMIATAVCDGLWPLWKLPGKPEFADGKGLAILGERTELLKRAWLSRTGHKRPGLPDGLPLEQAQAEAERLMERYRSEVPVTQTRWKAPSALLGGSDAHRGIRRFIITLTLAPPVLLTRNPSALPSLCASLKTNEAHPRPRKGRSSGHFVIRQPRPARKMALNW